MNKTNTFGKPIYTYSDKQAVADGFLLDLFEADPRWKKGIFRFVTINLLEQKGYLTGEKLNYPNLVDLLNQATQLVKRNSNNFKDFDTFFSGSIEFPSGRKGKIFIAQNGTGKFTIMLPEDN